MVDARLWAMQSKGGVCEACECKVNLKNYGSYTHSFTKVDAQGKGKALQRRLNFISHELCFQEDKGEAIYRIFNRHPLSRYKYE